MNLHEYLAAAESIERDGAAALNGAADPDALEQARIAYLGDRQGRVKALQEALRGIPKEDKPAAGKRFNEARTRLVSLHDDRKAALECASTGVARDDLSLPARRQWRGAKHPVTLVIEEIEGIFRELGFTIAQGPEAETEWYNFGALNFPPNHPALDAHDTLYLDAPPAEGEPAGRLLLRTRTSPVQIRTLLASPPPVRVVIPGMVYRNDAFDASHSPAFSQIEGLAVDEGISFVDLKATLIHFAHRFFSPSTRTRFRPSFFPFTELSAEMDVECQLCHGSGCPACKGTGWMEILGCGMVHPAVLENCHLDSERYTGWAFGMGPHRIAMLRYGIPDIRLLLEGDMRFLEQVGRLA